MFDADKFAQSRQVHDIQGLDKLRQSAQKNEDEALTEVAKQFEGMFVQMLIKSMRQANEAFESDSPFNSNYTQFYEQMGDQQMAQDLTQSGSFGLAELMVQQLRPDGDKVRPASVLRMDGSDQLLPAVSQAQSNGSVSGNTGDGNSAQGLTFSGEAQLTGGNGLPLAAYMRAAFSRQNSVTEGAVADQAAVTEPLSDAPSSRNSVTAPVTVPVAKEPSSILPELDFSSPQAFVSSVMPYAKKAAASLGTSPTVLVAQAALETGWGQKAIKRNDGSSSFNLFNIKADSRWQGESVSVNTLEYEQDLPVQRRAAFRAYDSVAESFNDFVDFLKKSPRYQSAISVSDDSANFLHNLQQAGYATDPRYAEKVLNVLKQVNSLL